MPTIFQKVGRRPIFPNFGPATSVTLYPCTFGPNSHLCPPEPARAPPGLYKVFVWTLHPQNTCRSVQPRTRCRSLVRWAHGSLFAAVLLRMDGEQGARRRRVECAAGLPAADPEGCPNVGSRMHRRRRVPQSKRSRAVKRKAECCVLGSPRLSCCERPFCIRHGRNPPGTPTPGRQRPGNPLGSPHTVRTALQVSCAKGRRPNQPRQRFAAGFGSALRVHTDPKG